MQAEETESVEVENSQASAQATEAENSESQDLAQQKKKNNLEYNWAEARRSIEQRDKEIKELKAQLAAPKEAVRSLDEDDLLTAKNGRQVFRQEAEAIVSQALLNYEASTIEERLIAKFPDFNEVVSTKNIEFLKETEPELAMSIANLANNPKAQSIVAYKLLKKLGIGSNNNSSPEKDKAVKNAQKPLSVNAVTRQSAIGNAHLFENGLTPELKSQLWKEMQDCMKFG